MEKNISMKKKICFYMNTFLVGGIEKVLIELLENIDKNKFLSLIHIYM